MKRKETMKRKEIHLRERQEKNENNEEKENNEKKGKTMKRKETVTFLFVWFAGSALTHTPCSPQLCLHAYRFPGGFRVLQMVWGSSGGI
jgi:hypothetical protein